MCELLHERTGMSTCVRACAGARRSTSGPGKALQTALIKLFLKYLKQA